MGVLRDTFREPMFRWTLLLVLVIFLAVWFISKQPPAGYYTSKTRLQKPPMMLKHNVDYQAEIYTDLGNIKIDLLEDVAPENVNNFIYLAKRGYYKNNYWHRIITNVLIQTGDPTGTGKGGPGYYIQDEINDRTPKMAPGIVAMASFGQDKNGSQFFIIASKAPKSVYSKWDGKYTVFGRVIKGQEVVDKIAAIKADKNGKPSKKIKISKIVVLEISK